MRFLVTLTVCLQLVVRPALATSCTDPLIESDTARLERIVWLMEERLRVAEPVAAWKWNHGVPITDAERERAVLDTMAERARQSGLDEAAVRDFFRLQIDMSRERQRALFEGFSRKSPADSADLVQARTTIDTTNRALLQSLLLALPLFENDEPSRPAVANALGVSRDALLRTPEIARRLHRTLAALRRLRMPTHERVRGSGALVVGVPADYPPFAWRDEESCLHGIDIERMRSLAYRLGAEPLFVRTAWDTLATDLAKHRFDIAAGGITITPERAAHGAFSQPYHRGGKTAVARCADQQRFDRWEKIDRAGTRIIVNPGGTNEAFVRAHVHHAAITVFPDNLRIFEELADGNADVMITDDVEVALQTTRNPALCRTLPGLLTHSEKAFYTTKETEWLDVVNEWLSTRLIEE